MGERRFLLRVPTGAEFLSIVAVGQVHLYGLYEIDVVPTITEKKIYPIIHNTGIEPSYSMSKIDYLPKNGERLYKIGENSTWKKWEGQDIRVENGETIYAKGIYPDGYETAVSSYTAIEPPDSIPESTYNNNNGLIFDYKVNTRRMYIDKSMWGKNIFIEGSTGEYANNPHLSEVRFLDENKKLINKQVLYLYSSPPQNHKEFEVPDNTYQVEIYMHNSGYNTPYMTKIGPVLASKSRSANKDSTQSSSIPAPKYKLNSFDWNIEKQLTVDYGNNKGSKEYSIDLGKTWLNYIGPITVKENTTILTRVMNNGKLITSSSYKVTKIDSTEPTVSLDSLPTTFQIGADYKLPSSYIVDESKSGGKSICKINDVEYQTTKNLLPGKYTVTCTVTTGTGLINTTSKQIEVLKDEKKIEETVPKSTSSPPIDTTQPKSTEGEETKNTDSEILEESTE